MTMTDSGEICLTSETVTEAKFFLSLKESATRKAAPKEKVVKVARKGPWAGKHKKVCDICGAKKVNLKAHIKFAHEGVKTGYAARRAKELLTE